MDFKSYHHSRSVWTWKEEILDYTELQIYRNGTSQLIEVDCYTQVTSFFGVGKFYLSVDNTVIIFYALPTGWCMLGRISQFHLTCLYDSVYISYAKSVLSYVSIYLFGQKLFLPHNTLQSMLLFHEFSIYFLLCTCISSVHTQTINSKLIWLHFCQKWGAPVKLNN